MLSFNGVDNGFIFSKTITTTGDTDGGITINHRHIVGSLPESGKYTFFSGGQSNSSGRAKVVLSINSDGDLEYIVNEGGDFTGDTTGTISTSFSEDDVCHVVMYIGTDASDTSSVFRVWVNSSTPAVDTTLAFGNMQNWYITCFGFDYWAGGTGTIGDFSTGKDDINEIVFEATSGTPNVVTNAGVSRILNGDTLINNLDRASLESATQFRYWRCDFNSPSPTWTGYDHVPANHSAPIQGTDPRGSLTEPTLVTDTSLLLTSSLIDPSATNDWSSAKTYTPNSTDNDITPSSVSIDDYTTALATAPVDEIMVKFGQTRVSRAKQMAAGYSEDQTEYLVLTELGVQNWGGLAIEAYPVGTGSQAVVPSQAYYLDEETPTDMSSLFDLTSLTDYGSNAIAEGDVLGISVKSARIERGLIVVTGQLNTDETPTDMGRFYVAYASWDDIVTAGNLDNAFNFAYIEEVSSPVWPTTSNKGLDFNIVVRPAVFGSSDKLLVTASDYRNSSARSEDGHVLVLSVFTYSNGWTLDGSEEIANIYGHDSGDVASVGRHCHSATVWEGAGEQWYCLAVEGDDVRAGHKVYQRDDTGSPNGSGTWSALGYTAGADALQANQGTGIFHLSNDTIVLGGDEDRAILSVISLPSTPAVNSEGIVYGFTTDYTKSMFAHMSALNHDFNVFQMGGYDHVASNSKFIAVAGRDQQAVTNGVDDYSTGVVYFNGYPAVFTPMRYGVPALNPDEQWIQYMKPDAVGSGDIFEREVYRTKVPKVVSGRVLHCGGGNTEISLSASDFTINTGNIDTNSHGGAVIYDGGTLDDSEFASGFSISDFQDSGAISSVPSSLPIAGIAYSSDVDEEADGNTTRSIASTDLPVEISITDSNPSRPLFFRQWMYIEDKATGLGRITETPTAGTALSAFEPANNQGVWMPNLEFIDTDGDGVYNIGYYLSNPEVDVEGHQLFNKAKLWWTIENAREGIELTGDAVTMTGFTLGSEWAVSVWGKVPLAGYTAEALAQDGSDLPILTIPTSGDDIEVGLRATLSGGYLDTTTLYVKQGAVDGSEDTSTIPHHFFSGSPVQIILKFDGTDILVYAAVNGQRTGLLTRSSVSGTIAGDDELVVSNLDLISFAVIEDASSTTIDNTDFESSTDFVPSSRQSAAISGTSDVPLNMIRKLLGV